MRPLSPNIRAANSCSYRFRSNTLALTTLSIGMRREPSPQGTSRRREVPCGLGSRRIPMDNVVSASVFDRNLYEQEFAARMFGESGRIQLARKFRGAGQNF